MKHVCWDRAAEKCVCRDRVRVFARDIHCASVHQGIVMLLHAAQKAAESARQLHSTCAERLVAANHADRHLTTGMLSPSRLGPGASAEQIVVTLIRELNAVTALLSSCMSAVEREQAEKEEMRALVAAASDETQRALLRIESLEHECAMAAVAQERTIQQHRTRDTLAHALRTPLSRGRADVDPNDLTMPLPVRPACSPSTSSSMWAHEAAEAVRQLRGELHQGQGVEVGTQTHEVSAAVVEIQRMLRGMQVCPPEDVSVSWLAETFCTVCGMRVAVPATDRHP